MNFELKFKMSKGKTNPKVYIETSIIGYLTSRPSRDLITAANQQLTRDWWIKERGKYDLFSSTVVLKEINLGDKDASVERVEAIGLIPILDLRESDIELAQALVKKYLLPKKAATDALHIAVATTREMDYLLTWNCRHIANAAMRKPIEEFLKSKGYRSPTICTPQDLQGSV